MYGEYGKEDIGGSHQSNSRLYWRPRVTWPSSCCAAPPGLLKVAGRSLLAGVGEETGLQVGNRCQTAPRSSVMLMPQRLCDNATGRSSGSCRSCRAFIGGVAHSGIDDAVQLHAPPAGRMLPRVPLLPTPPVHASFSRMKIHCVVSLLLTIGWWNFILETLFPPRHRWHKHNTGLSLAQNKRASPKTALFCFKWQLAYASRSIRKRGECRLARQSGFRQLARHQRTRPCLQAQGRSILVLQECQVAVQSGALGQVVDVAQRIW